MARLDRHQQIGLRQRQGVVDLSVAVVGVHRNDARAQCVQGQEVEKMARMVAQGQGHTMPMAPATSAVEAQQRVDLLAGLFKSPDATARERRLGQKGQAAGAPPGGGKGLVQAA